MWHGERLAARATPYFCPVGIVIRQSAKQTIVTLAGVAIGAVNVLLIYPLALTEAELGLLRFVIDTATLIMPLLLLGMNLTTVKFFPEFKTADSSRHAGLLTMQFMVTTAMALLAAGLLLAFGPRIEAYYARQSPLYAEVLGYVLPLAFIMALFLSATGFTQNFKRVAIPQVFNTLYLKIGLPVLALLYWQEIIGLQGLFRAVFVIYVAILASQLIYLHRLGQLNINFDFIQLIDRRKLREIATYAGFGVVSTMGTIVVLRIDSFMVASLAGLASNGIFAVASFIANVIDAPTAAVNSIAGPLVSQAWQRNDRSAIATLYRKSSLNLLIAGLGLLGCIWLGLDDLFRIMPKGEVYAAGKPVILLLGAGKLFDMATSINNAVIGMSARYRFNFYAILGLAVFNVGANAWLIPQFGIVGAALASFLSLLLYNLLKLGFIWRAFGMQPFSWATVKLSAIAIGCFGLAWLIPHTGRPLLDIVVRCGSYALAFGTTVVGLQLSDDLNGVLVQLWQRLRR